MDDILSIFEMNNEVNNIDGKGKTKNWNLTKLDDEKSYYSKWRYAQSDTEKG